MKHPIRLFGLCLVALLLSPVIQAGETTNSIGITMVDIPAGSFLMGSCKLTESMKAENKKRAFVGQAPLSAGNCTDSDPDASHDETPQHRVTVKAFQMGKTEVTLGQFKKFIAATGRTSLVDDDFMKYNAYGDNAPVVQVSWEDAQDFIKWLNQTEGKGWRLPSEAEWEYACRAGGRHTYCGSNNIDDVAWHANNSGDRQRSVATKKPNAFGVYDMSGNVWEWVEDCWHDNYEGAPRDGSVWTGGNCARRVLRGGSWKLIPRDLRSAYRFSFSPGLRDGSFGFRLARTR